MGCDSHSITGILRPDHQGLIQEKWIRHKPVKNIRYQPRLRVSYVGKHQLL